MSIDRFNLNRPIPLLILGDSPDLKTGLGRLGHDLAWQLSALPQFKVGYLGRAGLGKARYPWASYSFPVSEQWGEMQIEAAWEDLSQGEYGIILTLWDASRLVWFANPIGLPDHLQAFLSSGKFERWGYFMQDSAGIDSSRLPMECADVFSRYGRVLLASKWAYGLTLNTLQLPDVDWIPHGINEKIFRLQEDTSIEPWEVGRAAWGIGKNERVVGCVMANQARKHWPVVFEAIAMMPGVRLWIHTDRLLGYWNIEALAVEYGIADRIIYEGKQLSDREISHRYMACNATTVISGGEGFCYPVGESLSAGTPVVTGSYGAAAELIPARHRVNPSWDYVDTSHNVRRAQYAPDRVAVALNTALLDGPNPEEYHGYVEHLGWNNLNKVWKKWFLKGIGK